MPRARRMGLELWWKLGRSVSDTQGNSEKAWVDTKDSFEEDVAGEAVRQEHAFHEGEEQEQQEAGEMKVPIAPSDEERRYHNPTHYPYKEWCEHCVRGRG
eukprot:125076-Amphidinium_carterae.1